MKHRYTTFFLFLFTIIYFSGVCETKNLKVLGTTTINNKAMAATKNEISVKTTTAFDQKEEIVYEAIPYEIEYVDDDEMEYGKEKILEEGTNGTKTLTYLITYWIDEEIDRQLIDTKIDTPKNEITAKGTKIIWREYMTSDVGGVWYWHI